MKLKDEAPQWPRLQHLDEDCLMGIFGHLELAEQFALLSLDARFERVVRRLWRRQYSATIDFHREQQLKLLPEQAFEQLLGIVAGYPTELRNLDGRMWARVSGSAPGRSSMFANISKITLVAPPTPSNRPRRQRSRAGEQSGTANGPVSLRQFTRFPNLCELHILHCSLRPCEVHGELAALFRHLPLKAFVFLPAACDTPTTMPTTTTSNFSPQLTSIAHCRTLQRLTLFVEDLTAAAATLRAVAQLPDLQQLTVCNSAATSANRTNAAHRRLVLALKQARLDDISVLRLRCHIDSELARLLQSLPQLSVLCWHAHLHVDYLPDGGIQWPHCEPPQVASAMVEVVATCPQLTWVDFRWNWRVTHEVVGQVARILQQRSTAAGSAVRPVHFACDGAGAVRGECSGPAGGGGWLEFQFTTTGRRAQASSKNK